MKGKLNLYYDEEGDFLEINVGKQAKGDFKNLGEGIFERINGNQVTGIAIHGFKKRTQGMKQVKISLPFTIELSS
jgi:hypothetical protein